MGHWPLDRRHGEARDTMLMSTMAPLKPLEDMNRVPLCLFCLD